MLPTVSSRYKMCNSVLCVIHFMNKLSNLELGHYIGLLKEMDNHPRSLRVATDTLVINLALAVE